MQSGSSGDQRLNARGCKRNTKPEPETPVSALIVGMRLSNSNWTEWITIQEVIARVISKSDEREARVRFEITRRLTP